MEGPTSKKTKEPPKRANHKGNTNWVYEKCNFCCLGDGWGMDPLLVLISYYTSFE